MAAYLRAQAAAGAQALMLFESWAGLLAPREFERFALRAVRRTVAALRDTGVPLIYYVNQGSALMECVADLDVDVIGVDWRSPLGVVRRKLGPDKAVQGNLDPAALFAPPEELRRHAARVLDEAGGRRAHLQPGTRHLAGDGSGCGGAARRLRARALLARTSRRGVRMTQTELVTRSRFGRRVRADRGGLVPRPAGAHLRGLRSLRAGVPLRGPQLEPAGGAPAAGRRRVPADARRSVREGRGERQSRLGRSRRAGPQPGRRSRAVRTAASSPAASRSSRTCGIPMSRPCT